MITNRSPLFTPISSFGIQMVQRMDALIGGLNMEISPKATLWRRFPFTRFCSTQFGANDWPLTWTSFKNLSGTIYPIVDTPTHVYSFTPSSMTAIYTKGTTAQSSFCGSRPDAGGVGNFLYWCDGNSAQKWDGTHQWLWGISAPIVTPGLSYAAGSLSPTSGYTYVYCYINTVTGHISSGSPVSANTGPQTSKNITVSYSASSDPQVSAIWIFRTVDGGGLYYFLASVANTNGSYTDSTSDSGLNKNLIADVSAVNAPPPTGIAHTAFYAGRPWALVGNVLYAGAGPDATIGVGVECWPGANNWVLPGSGTCLRATSVGLAVFTADDLYILTGNDLSSFTLLPWEMNFGVSGENSVTQDGDLLFVFTSRSMLYSIQYGASLSEIGFNIRDKLGSMNSSNVYIALHRSGQDEGLFVSDGAYNVWRYGMDFGSWSPPANPLMGVRAISSIETSLGVWTLLLGTGVGSKYIYGRNPSATSFQDDGTAYPCFATIGNLIVAPPGQIATPEKVLVQVTGSGAFQTQSICLQDSNSVNWLLTVSDAGILQTAHGGSAPQTIFLNDSVLPNTSWRLSITTGGLLQPVSVTYDPTYPTTFGFLSTPSSLVCGGITISNGILSQPTPGNYTYPTVAVLPNNVSGTFTNLPVTGDDPPQVSGTSYASTNPVSKFHSWRGVQSNTITQQVQSVQIRVVFTTDTTQSEILGVGLV